MSDWFIATEGVKIVKDSASLWPQIITAVSAAGAALGGVCLTHRFTRLREKRAAEDKAAAERLYLATELAFLLEQYAVAWSPLRWTELFKFCADKNTIPTLDLSDARGDWRVLPASLIFRIRSLEVDQTDLQLRVSSSEYLDHPIESVPLTYRCLKSGIRAFVLAAKLRRSAGLPDSPLLKDRSGPFKTLRDLRRRYWHRIALERRTAKNAFLNMKFPLPPVGENGTDRG